MSVFSEKNELVIRARAVRRVLFLDAFGILWSLSFWLGLHLYVSCISWSLSFWLGLHLYVSCISWSFSFWLGLHLYVSCISWSLSFWLGFNLNTSTISWSLVSSENVLAILWLLSSLSWLVLSILLKKGELVVRTVGA